MARSTHENHDHHVRPAGAQPAGGVQYLHPAVIRNEDGSLVYVPDVGNQPTGSLLSKVTTKANPNRFAEAGRIVGAAAERMQGETKGHRANPVPKAESIAESQVSSGRSIGALVLAIIALMGGFFPGILFAWIALRLSKPAAGAKRDQLGKIAHGVAVAALVISLLMGLAGVLAFAEYGVFDTSYDSFGEQLENVIDEI